MNRVLYNTLLFFFLLSLQVLVFNQIRLLGYISPYPYIAFVFLYPLRKKRFAFLLLSFSLGLCIDFFSDSGGIHAFSLLFIAYIRLWLFRVVFKKNETDYFLFDICSEPFKKKLFCTSVLTLIHHFILFSLARFSLSNFTDVLINTIFSSIFTLSLFYMGTYILKSKR